MPVTIQKVELAPLDGANAGLRVAEFVRLVQAGWFGDRRVELINGGVYVKMSQGRLHVLALAALTKVLGLICGDSAFIAVQSTLTLAEDTEVEPDLAMYRGDPLEYAGEPRPEDALLVVEVADTSLRTDRLIKGELYARARIPEYWIVNPVARQVEVYREPEGGAYRSLEVLTLADSVTSLVLGVHSIRVADFMPRLGASVEERA
jgi:Uma2 family endonuclease